MNHVITEGNKIAAMLNLDGCLKAIEKAKNNGDNCVILCGHWSINKPKYTEDEYNNEAESEDFWEMEQFLTYPLTVSDYDDLIIDLNESED